MTLCIGLYCSGWVKTGPVGVILTTMNKAFETAEVIYEDFTKGKSIITAREYSNVIVSENSREAVSTTKR